MFYGSGASQKVPVGRACSVKCVTLLIVVMVHSSTGYTWVASQTLFQWSSDLFSFCSVSFSAHENENIRVNNIEYKLRWPIVTHNYECLAQKRQAPNTHHRYHNIYVSLIKIEPKCQNHIILLILSYPLKIKQKTSFTTYKQNLHPHNPIINPYDQAKNIFFHNFY